jgi:hypothetical protein
MWAYLTLTGFLFAQSPAAGQEGVPVPSANESPFDEGLKLLDFREPTTIQGRVRLIDEVEQALWLDWEMRLDVYGPGRKEWRNIEGEFLLLLHALDSEQFARLRAVEVGSRLLLVVQSDEDGRRRILAYQDARLPPQFPL